MTRRVFLIVLDSFGIGQAPDAADFGDLGASTLQSVVNTGILNIPNLESLGLGCIDGVDALAKSAAPKDPPAPRGSGRRPGQSACEKH